MFYLTPPPSSFVSPLLLSPLLPTSLFLLPPKLIFPVELGSLLQLSQWDGLACSGNSALTEGAPSHRLAHCNLTNYLPMFVTLINGTYIHTYIHT